MHSLDLLLRNHFRPRKTVEFHFYAAEEVGLRGSQDIAVSYVKQQRNVVGMLQLDMLGYVVDAENDVIAIPTDYTDPALTEFLCLVVAKYSGMTFALAKCGYGCSDHAS
jgi:leucyl aminopeptidase